MLEQTGSKNLTQELYSKAKKIIPGGTQLLSKRPEMSAPDLWPAYFSRASGCEVWDLDGKHYYDMATNGIGSCLLGFCDPDVNSAVKKRICNERCIKKGAFESFRYGYMTLGLDPEDRDTFYYISGFDEIMNAPDQKDGRESMPYLLLTTYNLASQKYTDHGIIQLEDGRYPTLTQSILVHPNGRIYTCPWIPRTQNSAYDEYKQQCDLISFRNPLK